MNSITGIISTMAHNIFYRNIIPICIVIFAITGCSNKSDKGDEGDTDDVKGKVEAAFTNPRIGTIAQYETLNATTVYQLNDGVRAPIAGYIRKVNVTLGQVVKAGDVLFTMQTKEAAAMGGVKDSLFPSTGSIPVKATEAGIVKTITRQVGDYIQDGDELCTIANNASLIFILDVPFEIRKYIKEGSTYKISLVDGESVQATIASLTPEMDKSVQMERYVLRSAIPLNLPEGLTGTVSVQTRAQTKTVILPKTAVLSNEAQTQFWLMKLLNDSTAVKVNIEKGIETKDSVQIISPAFTDKDKILTSGNYGLADTVPVKTGNK